MAKPIRLAMDAHFHGHDGALLSEGYSFAEIAKAVECLDRCFLEQA